MKQPFMNYVMCGSLLLLAFPSTATNASEPDTAFNVQCRLTREGFDEVNGPVDLRFRLWDSEAGGIQLGDDCTVTNVMVTDGLISVPVDFGLEDFNGKARWLEVGISEPGLNQYAFPTARLHIYTVPAAIHALTVAVNSIGPDQVRTNAITTDKIADGAITSQKLHKDLRLSSSSLDASGDGPKEAVFVDDQGNVGIGTRQPGAKLDVEGAVKASAFEGSGSALDNLDATKVMQGKLPDDRLSSNVALKSGDQSFQGAISGRQFLGDGSMLTNLDAAKIAGRLTTNQLSSDVALKTGDQAFAGSITAVGFAGNGAALTSLDAAKVTLGKLPDERLSSNVALKTSDQTFGGTITATGFAGSGSALTGLDAAKVTQGRLSDDRLSTNVALTSGNEVFLGTISATGFIGDGSSLSNLTAAGINGTLQASQLTTNVALRTGDQTFAGTIKAARFDGDGSTLTGLSATNVGGLDAYFRAHDGPGSNFDADRLDGLDSSAFWRLGGNAGTTSPMFLGTTDNHTLELKANNETGLRIQPGQPTPSLVGGYSGNAVASDVSGSTIAGGGLPNALNRIDAGLSFIGGGQGNTIEADARLSTIGGGDHNIIYTGATNSTIAGGAGNKILSNAKYSTIAGGEINLISNGAYDSFVGSGYWNTCGTGARYAAIPGGCWNIISNGIASTIAGGWENRIGVESDYSAVGGGIGNSVLTKADSCTIAGGDHNVCEQQASYGTISGGQGNTIGAGNWKNTIGGGADNQVGPSSGHATITGGAHNRIGASTDVSTISGGHTNVIGDRAWASVIGGGQANTIRADAYFATIAGGFANVIATNSWCGTVAGGQFNEAGPWAFAAGYRAKARHSSSFVWADGTQADFASTGLNQFLVRAAGGVGLGTSSPQAQLHVNGTVVLDSSAQDDAFVRVVSSPSVDGYGALRFDQGAPNYFAVWSTTTGNPTTSALCVGYGHTQYSGPFGITIPAEKARENPIVVINYLGQITANGVQLSSDRALKENVVPVDAKGILRGLEGLPIARWHFKADPHTAHIGPMAQDFRASFGVGQDDTHISAADADGVALAAIKGLYELVREKDVEIAELRKSVAELREVMGLVPQAVSRSRAGGPENIREGR